MIKGGNVFDRWKKDILLINNSKLFNSDFNGNNIHIYQ